MSDNDSNDPFKDAPPPGRPNPGLHGLNPGELLARGLDTAKPSGGSSAWEPPTPEELSRLLPQYRIESLIGRGGMGAVYKGTQVVLDRPVAVKLLPAEIAADEQFIARFHREARTLARLQHSRIITIHNFGQTSEGHLYFVMEFIDGTDLRHILRGPGLSADQSLLVVGQICDALHAAHSHGVIHRDIKPENILITKDGYVKLADFGISRPLKEEDASPLTEANTVIGTADYMAPEQREGQTDERADIFALGVMLYEMLTGHTPRGAFEPVSKKMQVDVRIDEVVLKALQAEPGRRYQRVHDMKTDVDRIRNTPLPAPPAKPPVPSAPTGNRRRKLACAAAFLAPVLGLLAWMLLPSHERPFSASASPASENANSSVRAHTPQTAAVKTAPHADAPPAASQEGAPSLIPDKPVAYEALAKGTPEASVANGSPTGMEDALFRYHWSFYKGWVMNFKPHHIIKVTEGGPPLRTWHWWIIGKDKIHIQFAAQPAQMDPSIGADITFNPGLTEYVMVNFTDAEKHQVGKRMAPVEMK